MSLPERTLCWVQGPPWDRSCTPVEEMNASELAAAAEALREQLPPMPELERKSGRPPIGTRWVGFGSKIEVLPQENDDYGLVAARVLAGPHSEKKVFIDAKEFGTRLEESD
jgi:hypothetical protein